MNSKKKGNGKPGPSSQRTRVRRVPANGDYDRETIYQIFDDAYIAQVAYCDGTQARVIPMVIWRTDNFLYIHGSTKSKLMKDLASGLEACITVTHVDGLVLARSAFHHSMNYRSVVLYATAENVVDPELKWKALEAFMDQLLPGRWQEARTPNQQEMKATMVLRFPIEEASAKVRRGGPNDEEEDYQLPVWAGVVPLVNHRGNPIPDTRLRPGTALPDYL